MSTQIQPLIVVTDHSTGYAEQLFGAARSALPASEPVPHTLGTALTTHDTVANPLLSPETNNHPRI